MKLSVIIPAYNAAGTIGEQLDAFSRQRWDEPWELLVVNNKSTDETVAIARQYERRIPNLRMIDALDRQGAAYAINTGARFARSNMLAFCDADDVVGDGWIAAMGKGLQTYPFVSGPFEITRLNQHPLQKHRTNAQPAGIQQYTYPSFLPHAGSGNMGIRREIFEQVGMFDETLPVLYDTDLCWKVQLAGVALTPLPNAVLHVRFRDTVEGLVRQAYLYAVYNVFLYKRYRPQGMPKLTVAQGLRAWADLVLGFKSAITPDKRPRFLWNIAWRTGRLYASIRYGVWAL